MQQVYASHTLSVNVSRTRGMGSRYLGRMERPDGNVRKDFGSRLKAARLNAKMTQDAAAVALDAKKATVSSWEIGNNLPDPITLGRLAKLYGVTADLLIWDQAISMEAISIAVQYDALGDKQKRAFMAMWLAYFAQAKSDEEVGEALKDANEDLNKRNTPKVIQDRGGESGGPKKVKR
jgi:transcriptional regulator with XRE-family HTH domain